MEITELPGAKRSRIEPELEPLLTESSSSVLPTEVTFSPQAGEVIPVESQALPADASTNNPLTVAALAAAANPDPSEASQELE